MGLPADILQMNVGQILQSTTVPGVDLSGWTIVVTGANSGLGLEAAKHLYQLNVSHLILACRSIERGEDARRKIMVGGKRSAAPGKVEVWPLDYSSYNSVLAFGDRLNTLDRLDSFVANAGIVVTHFERFEGHESSLTVNVISTLLVSLLAIPKLRQSAVAYKKPSRLVVVGTVVHIFAKNKYLSTPSKGKIIASLDDEKKSDMGDRYVLSKLILLLAFRELVARMNRDGEKTQSPVIATWINPGWCKTDLFRYHDPGLGGKIGLALIGRSAEEGSRTLVHAAIGSSKEMHGEYLSECRVKQTSTWSRTPEASRVQKDVWEELAGILESVRPGITRIV